MGVKEFQISDRNIVIHELDDLYDSTTGRVLTGSWVWNSAFVLAEWMATQCKLFDFDFRDKTVIELGAGAGLPGLMAALLGARRVVLTDVEPLLPGLLKNADANGLGDRVEVRELVWGSDESVSKANELGEFDLILMSDLFYDSDEMPPLAHILKIISGKDSKIWAASEIRPWTIECITEFINQGFEIKESPVQHDEPHKGRRPAILDSFSIFHLKQPDEETSNCINPIQDPTMDHQSSLIEFTNQGFEIKESQVHEPLENNDHAILDSFSIFHLTQPDEERNI